MDKIVNIVLDSDLWQQARVAALKQGLTVREWLTDAIKAKLELIELAGKKAK